jgi:hypothetical protein
MLSSKTKYALRAVLRLAEKAPTGIWLQTNEVAEQEQVPRKFLEWSELHRQLAASFKASNSVQPGGIGIKTGGNGPVTGQEVEIDAAFSDPFSLPADHYFFVPQVSSTAVISSGCPRRSPELAFDDPGIAPDWLRVGTDIVGAGAFDATFSLTGARYRSRPVLLVLGTAVAGLGLLRRRST